MTEAMWAPWRMEFIQTLGGDGCFLCDAGAADDEAADSLVICRRGNALAILNRWPYSNGHLLIAPLAHKSELEDLTDDEMIDLFSMVRDIKLSLAAATHAHGFNIGINLGRVAGAGLPAHLHVHVVPRWSGDTNFMPVIGDTKVIPQSLADARNCIREEWLARFGEETCE